jgi:hypothetical protein
VKERDEMKIKEDEVGEVAMSAIYDIRCMFLDIQQAAHWATGDGYHIEVIGLFYRAVPEPTAKLRITAPNGNLYIAMIRFLPDEGWTLDHISEWHKSEKQP